MSTTNCKFTVVKDESLKTIMDEIAYQVEIINERPIGEKAIYGYYTLPRWEFIISDDIVSVKKWKYNYKNDCVTFLGHVYLNKPFRGI